VWRVAIGGGQPRISAISDDEVDRLLLDVDLLEQRCSTK